MNKKIRICFLASNNLRNDPRVLRLAKGAAQDGFDTLALGFYWIAQGHELPVKEKIEGFTIQRVLYRPSKIFGQSKAVSLMALTILSRLGLAWFYFLIDRLQGKKGEAIRKDPPVNLASDETLSKKTNSSFSNSALRKIISPIGRVLGKLKWKLYLYFIPFLASFDYYAAMTYQLSEATIRFRPDIIYANDLDSLWAGYLVKRKIGAKLIFDAHEFWLDMGLQVPKAMVWAFKMSEKYLLKKIDGYVTVNESIIRKTGSYYNHRFKVPALVVYNCPYYQKVGSSRSNSRSGGKIKILYQGRFALHRGLEQLVEAMKYLPTSAELYFRAIKDPPMEKILKKIVKKNQLEKKVKFLSAVPMTKMVQAAKGFDIGVVAYVPVHADNELCTPNKLFEYMMAGLALAVSDLPVLRYITKKCQNGVLFNPREPQSIARALNDLISHPEKRRRMQQNSLKAAANPFCWEKQQEKLNSLYGELLSS